MFPPGTRSEMDQPSLPAVSPDSPQDGAAGVVLQESSVLAQPCGDCSPCRPSAQFMHSTRDWLAWDGLGVTQSWVHLLCFPLSLSKMALGSLKHP